MVHSGGQKKPGEGSIWPGERENLEYLCQERDRGELSTPEAESRNKGSERKKRPRQPLQGKQTIFGDTGITRTRDEKKRVLNLDTAGKSESARSRATSQLEEKSRKGPTNLGRVGVQERKTGSPLLTRGKEGKNAINRKQQRGCNVGPLTISNQRPVSTTLEKEGRTAKRKTGWESGRVPGSDVFLPFTVKRSESGEKKP